VEIRSARGTFGLMFEASQSRALRYTPEWSYASGTITFQQNRIHLTARQEVIWGHRVRPSAAI